MKKSILIIPFLSISILFSCSENSEDVLPNLTENSIELAEANDQFELNAKLSNAQIVNKLVNLPEMKNFSKLRDLAALGQLTQTQAKMITKLNISLRNKSFMKSLSSSVQNKVLSQAYSRLTKL